MRKHLLPGLASLYLFSCLNATPATAQEPFGCSSTQAESTFNANISESKVQIVPLTDKAEIAAAEAASPYDSFEQIDVARFGIKKIDFFLRRNTPPKPEEQEGYPPFSFYIRTISAKQTQWWRLQEPPPEPTENLFLTLNPARPDIGDDTPVKILPAAESASVPLYQLVWNRLEMGQWSVGVEAHLLLDFRAAQPKVIAQLACNSITAFGACGVYDAQQQAQSNFVCTWDTAKSDFNCEGSFWGGGKRTSKSWFELISNKDILFAVKPGDPNSLQKFAEKAEADASWRGRQVQLPSFGNTSHLLRLPLAHDQVVHVFGTYGDLQPFSANFYFVILSKTAPPQEGAIPVSFPLQEPDEAQQQTNLPVPSQNGTTSADEIDPNSQVRTGGSLSFNVNSLFTGPSTHIYRLTAKEDASHAVYWLAIESPSPDGKALIRGVKLAGDGCSYESCGKYITEPLAIAITMQEGEHFRAQLDVNPPYISDEGNERESQPGCPYLQTMEWNQKEWALEPPHSKCARAEIDPGRITINDDGSITITNYNVASQK
jgi:hypothetical protein